MARWIEIPAHRVLEVSNDAMAADYDIVRTDGLRTPWQEQGESAWLLDSVRIIRRYDEKVFRFPRFHPAMGDFGHVWYLEEL